MDKKMFVRMVAILGVLGMVASGPVAYAGMGEDPGPDHKRSWGEHKGPENFFKDLNLTPEQKGKVEAQREAQQALSKPVWEQMKVKMQALHEELGKPVSDQAVVNGLIADINTLKGQLFSQRIEGVLALKQVLTPEQFAKAQAKFGEHRGKHGGWKKDQGMKP